MTKPLEETTVVGVPSLEWLGREGDLIALVTREPIERAARVAGGALIGGAAGTGIAHFGTASAIDLAKVHLKGCQRVAAQAEQAYAQAIGRAAAEDAANKLLRGRNKIVVNFISDARTQGQAVGHVAAQLGKLTAESLLEAAKEVAARAVKSCGVRGAVVGAVAVAVHEALKSDDK